MTRDSGWALESSDRLSSDRQRDVLALAASITAYDHGTPLNEDAVLHLPSAGPARHHVVVAAGGAVIGYAQLRTDGSGASEAEIAAGPVPPASGSDLDGATERAEVAEALFDAAEARSHDLLVWSRADTSPVGAAARSRGYTEDRVLLAMSRPLSSSDAAQDIPLPAGVTIRPFRTGHDEAAWLGVNARAFADHPEQGRWTATDLAHRTAQPWFDPAGFFLAVDAADTVAGFHWTKIHPASAGTASAGEVYVIGLDPAAQGRGLGGVLLRIGLRHLARAGLGRVFLYTDESNRGAVALYRRTGFEVLRREVQFRRPDTA